MNEFFKMLGDPAHWAFEIFVTLVVDGLLVGIFWPLVRNCWQVWKAERDRDALIQDETLFGEMLRASVCDPCGAPRKRMDTSVDLCTSCGSVGVPEKKQDQTEWNQHIFRDAEIREKP